MKIRRSEHEEIRRLYLEERLTMESIGERYGVTRGRIHQILGGLGVDTSKGDRIEFVCAGCGRPSSLPRYRARGRDVGRLFCDGVCYDLFRETHSVSMGMARGKISEYFGLEEGHSVHAENGWVIETDLCNLRVFASDGEHADYHRGYSVEPVWDGRCVSASQMSGAEADWRKGRGR